jgi:glycosyltransferase involved in cell wall biosynthesis
MDPLAATAARLRVSVLMPTFEQAGFIRRALDSLQRQTMPDWELILVDDGSRDETPELVAEVADDVQVRTVRLPENVGLGAALNIALAESTAPLVAYLPSDDVYHRDHLATLCDALDAAPDAVLAFSGLRHHYNRYVDGRLEGEQLQLVQVAHRRTDDRWMERSELVTDDYDRMFWSKLAARGRFVGTGRVTAEWVDHPRQRHKVVREPIGGPNPYRLRYRVREPLRYHTTVGNRIDEVERYGRFRERPATTRAPDGLRILLVGELSYNPERILALEERGHELYGLWTPDPAWYTMVGPVPFGHIADLPPTGWQQAIRDLEPDVVYGLLNWHAVPFARAVLDEVAGRIPFVWHFKEGPFICLERGTWSDLVALTERADARIYSTGEMQAWFETVVPSLRGGGPSVVIDGDLPKAEWFARGERQTRISERDGEIHTVVPGRPIGLHPENVAALAANGIHLHFYGDFIHGQWKAWIERTKGLAPRHLHVHPNVDQEHWVQEFSQYDAGWLHWFRSRNEGDLHRADWDDLNVPARLATLAVAGLPVLQGDNSGHTVATQSLVRDHALGFFFRDEADLAGQLRDRGRLAELRENVWRQRATFTFDAHADRLVELFRTVVAGRSR